MNINLPPSVIVTMTGEGKKYQLPRHNLQPIALGIITFDLFLAIIFFIFITFFYNPGISTLSTDETDRLSLLLPLLFVSLPFFLFMLFVALLGVWLYAGHTEIELRDKYLIQSLRVGPLRWSNRLSLRGVRQFTVIRFGKVEDAGRIRIGPGVVTVTVPIAQETPLDLGTALVAEWASNRKWILAFGYSQQLLLALANELSQYCQLFHSSDIALSNTATPSPQIIEVSLDPAEVLERPQQPALSTAILTQHSDGVTITLPAMGLRRSFNSSLGRFALLWNLFIGAFSAILIPAFLADQQVEGDEWTGLFFIFIFWLGGVGLLLDVLHVGKRSAVLAVTKASLLISEAGLFGKQHHEWSKQCLVNVNLISEQHEGTDRTYWTTSLNIQPQRGKPYRLLSWCNKVELEWIATVLRQALKLSPVQSRIVLKPLKQPSRTQQWIGRIFTLVILLGAGLGWEIREGVNQAGETVILKNGPILAWQDTPTAADLPEVKDYVSVRIKRWYAYGLYQTGSSYGE